VNVAAMLAEKKDPVVICINGGEGNLETLGVKIGAAFRAGMEAMRRGKAEETKEGEEKGKEKKKEKKMTEAEAMDYISTQYKKWEENHQKK
jgi:Sec-independent protein translocase protein TatA